MRPSTPTIGFSGVTCIASLTRSGVILASPSATANNLNTNSYPQITQTRWERTINLMRRTLLATKESTLKHPKARHTQPLTPRKRLTCFLLLVLPCIARSSIEEDGGDEQVDGAAALLRSRHRGRC